MTKIVIIIILIAVLIVSCAVFQEHFQNETKRVCVVQFDTRMGTVENLDHLMFLNMRRCAKDTSCHYYFSSDNLGISPFWSKVKHVQNQLNNNYDYVMWMDTDAVIDLPDDLKLVDFIEHYIGDKDMLISNDMHPWDGSFNAGVWIVRNNEKGKEIIREWLNLYDHNLWKQENNKWTCPEQEWAECPGYEQGCFASNIINRYDNNISKVNWVILNNPYLDQFEANQRGVIHHFAGHHKDRINKYLEKT